MEFSYFHLYGNVKSLNKKGLRIRAKVTKHYFGLKYAKIARFYVSS